MSSGALIQGAYLVSIDVTEMMTVVIIVMRIIVNRSLELVVTLMNLGSKLKTH